MENKIQKISAVYSVSKNVSHILTCRNSLLSFFQLIKKVMETDTIFFYLYREEENALVLESLWGNSYTDYLPQLIKDDDETVLNEVLKKQQPVLTHLKELKSFIAVPVIVNNTRFMGVIAVGTTKSYAYNEDDVLALQLLSYQLATIDLLKVTVSQMQTLNDYILNSLTSGIISLDNKGRIERWNQTAKEIFSFLNSDFIGKNFEEIFAEYPQILRFFTESSGRFENKEVVIERNEEEITLLLNVFPLYDNKGGLLGKVIFFKDISDIKELKQKLFRAEKLSALGKVAAGIAHEIRNPLTGIRMLIQILEDEFPDNVDKAEHFNVIYSEIDRIEDLVKGMMDYGQPQEPKQEILNIVEFIQNFHSIYQKSLAEKGICFELTIDNLEPIYIKIDTRHLRQIFLNLLRNGEESIELKRKDYPFFQGSIGIEIERENRKVIINFKDNGIGMEEEQLDKIFIPFYTKKIKGTGLGLAITQRLVEDNGGYIEVDAYPGAGATFSLIFEEYKYE
jgi:PAS domain S-box-containing protein